MGRGVHVHKRSTWAEVVPGLSSQSMNPQHGGVRSHRRPEDRILFGFGHLG